MADNATSSQDDAQKRETLDPHLYTEMMQKVQRQTLRSAQGLLPAAHLPQRDRAGDGACDGLLLRAVEALLRLQQAPRVSPPRMLAARPKSFYMLQHKCKLATPMLSKSHVKPGGSIPLLLTLNVGTVLYAHTMLTIVEASHNCAPRYTTLLALQVLLRAKTLTANIHG